MPSSRNLTSTRLTNPSSSSSSRPTSTSNGLPPPQSSIQPPNVLVPPPPTNSASTSTARSPILNALSSGFSSLRARLPSPRDISLSPGQQDDVRGPSGAAPGGGKMKSERDSYPSRLRPGPTRSSVVSMKSIGMMNGTGDVKPSGSSLVPPTSTYSEDDPQGKNKSKARSPNTFLQTGYDERGYPIRTANSSPRTPVMTTGKGKGKEEDETPRATGRVVTTGLMGGTEEEIYLDDGRSRSRTSVISSAPSYTTDPVYPPYTGGYHTTNGNLLAPTTSRDTYLDVGGGNGRFSAYSSRNASPAPSFASDAPFGMENGWGDREKGGKGDEEDDGHYQMRALGSSTSLVSFDSRLAMGREMNVPGYVGLGGKYSLPMDLDLYAYGPEADDALHDPDERKTSRLTYSSGTIFTLRGIQNLGCLVIMILSLVTLFAGFPIITGISDLRNRNKAGYNIGGINATGQVPATIGNFGLIDKDTPQDAYTWQSLETGNTWDLVFSDEFNKDGRTFYPGDDPYWEAADLHYWATNNLEWYDPQQVTTANGSLVITLSNIENHNLNYMGGMMNSWNKFCFTGGYVEVSLSLPGKSDVYGLWPAVWTMGNLGRAGYGGTLEGLWPYTYNECDLGTLPNQTLNGQPGITTSSGNAQYNYELSYLPGQRLSRCTCPSDETHPGPKNPDGTWVGRAAPEIDMFEAQVDSSTLIGQVSQSAQWAPFNPFYNFINTSSTYAIYDDSMTTLNTYLGGAYQQSTSGLSHTNQNCYTGNTGCFSKYGYEYAPGDDGYVTWINNAKKAWTVRGAAMAPNTASGVGQRHVPDEPMYLILNVGISENFGAVDYLGLESLWPVTMLVDYIRVYQDPSAKNVGCDPASMPTAAYIARYPEAYNNPNITTWLQASDGAAAPKNNLTDTC